MTAEIENLMMGLQLEQRNLFSFHYQQSFGIFNKLQ